jgi:hypothetical protein
LDVLLVAAADGAAISKTSWGGIMRLLIRAGAALIAMLVVGCSSGGGGPRSELSSAPDIGITQAVWDAYNNRYLAEHTPLAFAVSENGATFYLLLLLRSYSLH